MNAKKNKNKRSKGAKAPDYTEKIDIPGDVKTFEEQVIEKKCDDNSFSISVEEITEQQEVPVKPKRKKGKNKVEEPTTETLNEQNEPKHEKEKEKIDTLAVTEQSLDTQSDRENESKQSSRKKKKNKKKTENVSESTENVRPITPHLESDTPATEANPTGQESAKKKKHKKKKHHDADKPEELLVTSAFQKLLEPVIVQEAIVSDSSCADNLNQDNKGEKQCMEGEVTSKRKKKNKRKNKVSETEFEKHSVNEESTMLAEQESTPVVVQEQEKEQEKSINLLEKTSCETTEEASLKPKAKIAKPVDKRRKEKIKQTTETQQAKGSVEECTQEQKDENSFQNDKKENIVELPKGAVESVVVDSNQKNLTPEKMTSENQESSLDNTLHAENASFIEVRPSRKKKRSRKNTEAEKSPTTTASENVSSCSINVQNDIQPQEIEDITPDDIQHPRSSSQLQFDNNNNNTIIREINTPDEAKLDIPILMSIPVVEGSGETPDVHSKKDPLDLEFTEIKSESIDSSEATCQKIDENSAMKELKLSIEKTLADLTAIEKCEMDAEKEFEEVLAYNLKDPLNLVDEKTKEVLFKEEKVVEKPETPLGKQDFIELIEKDNTENVTDACTPPVCPARKDKKGKSKKKSKKGTDQDTSVIPSSSSTTSSNNNEKSTKTTEESNKKEEQQKAGSQETKGKQQSLKSESENDNQSDTIKFEAPFQPIEKFEDALTSSTEDVNDTFEMIAKEASENAVTQQTPLQKPEISITEPEEDKNKDLKETVSPPKNLLGQNTIPVQSNKTDYKKEKNKPPNTIQAKVKVKDVTEIEKPKQSKHSQTKNKLVKQQSKEACTYKTNESDDFVYKYSFRKVFLPNVCHVCMKELVQRVVCKFCNLVFYCSPKHKDEDCSQHQFLCFAVCTIAHLKDQKFIYGDAKNITGQDYRILRMQAIMSCEKMLKRKLVPWEQEALLYPRICADTSCREWKQSLLTDCEECGQISYCSDHPEHLPISHQRWCKSYSLYHKLVTYQQIKGRLEPKLPTKVFTDSYNVPDKMNEVLAALYEEKIDMTDIEYAALTQIATAPLTTAYSYQLSRKNANGYAKKSTFTIHIVGAELQVEADVLNKWEIFFLHLKPDVKDLCVVLISPDLNPSNLPLELLAKIKLCELCRDSGRRLFFNFEDKKNYYDYSNSQNFITPDIVCAFNQSIERSSVHNGKDHWPHTIKSVCQLKVPLLITGNTLNELTKDISRIKSISNINIVLEPKLNSFSSVRPDRNFITDDVMPLLFKNYCYSVVCGA